MDICNVKIRAVQQPNTSKPKRSSWLKLLFWGMLVSCVCYVWIGGRQIEAARIATLEYFWTYR
ncbi:MAG: hypothetical protein ACKESB_00570 [Candidatus Hodgkinia cicadicola]